MRTIIDIPDSSLEDIQKTFNISTKKEAVTFALNEVLRYKRLKDLAAEMGNYDDHAFITVADLKKNRKHDSARHFSAH